jgi:hypothetical protein
MTRKGLRLISYVRVSDVRGREGPGSGSSRRDEEPIEPAITATLRKERSQRPTKAESVRTMPTRLLNSTCGKAEG